MVVMLLCGMGRNEIATRLEEAYWDGLTDLDARSSSPKIMFTLGPDLLTIGSRDRSRLSELSQIPIHGFWRLGRPALDENML